MLSKKSKTILVIALAILVIGGTGTWHFYRKVFKPNVTLSGSDNIFLYIPTGAKFNDVVHIVDSMSILKNIDSFRWVARQMGYVDAVKAGRYQLKNGMTNQEVVQLLRSGKQSPVKLMFHNIRSANQLAGIAARHLEADSASIISLLENEELLNKFGLNKHNRLVMFIPNTYEIYWNTTATGFINRMWDEYNKFWNEGRRQKAEVTGFTPVEVSILASIVEQESARKDERPDIAGVYINRIRKNWKLEADPTLIFAAGDFNIRRVLNVHKETDSPYNTYKHHGLPPGPICIPSISSIDAVLNFTDHDYMFFCAREDFSGYHSFAETYAQHLINARKFQRELNRRKISS
jgi:UPF0755 protein